ncbi:RNA polymerase sigma factor [Marivirga sp.]|uniref:RNA polymerase sigma factor n=1 Tax=Marivirga sp. TaxID=2018662 RepID=UPI003DA76200
MKPELIHQFYEDYHEQLIRFAKAIMRSQMDAEEAVHNVFRKLWDSEKLPEIKKPYPYLIQCTKFEAYALLAKEKNEQELNYRYFRNESEIIPQSSNREESMPLIRKAIEALPPKCKNIMLLKLDDGLTHSEISEYLKVSEKTVENQVTIAIKKVRKYLNKN